MHGMARMDMWLVTRKLDDGELPTTRAAHAQHLPNLDAMPRST